MGLNGNNTVELGKRFDINKDVRDNLAMLRGKDNGNLDYNGKFDLSQSMEVNSDSVDTSEKETFNSPLPDAQPMSTAERLAFQTEMDLNSSEGPKKVTETMIKCLKNIGDPESKKLLNEMIKNPKILFNLTTERIKKLSPEQRCRIRNVLGTSIMNRWTIKANKNKEGNTYYEINTNVKDDKTHGYLMAYYDKFLFSFFSPLTNSNNDITRYNGSINKGSNLSSDNPAASSPEHTMGRKDFKTVKLYDIKGVLKGFDKEGKIQKAISNLSDVIISPERIITNEDPNNYYRQAFLNREKNTSITPNNKEIPLNIAYTDGTQIQNTDISS